MREVELQETAEIIAGQSPKSEFYNETGEGVPFFQGKTDFGENYPTVTTWCTKPKKMAKEGDILFSVRAPVGPTNIAKVDCCIGRGLSAIRPGDEINRSYLRYFFKKIEQKISDQGRGSTFKAITQKDLKTLKIPLPSLSEQKAIVAKLDRAQRLIDIDREMLAKYDELIQSVFLEMFGDPVRNEKGLKQKEFGELVEITGGYAFKSKDFVDEESGVKVVKIANVHFIDLDWSEVQYLPIESLKEHEKYSLKKGDILLALTRPIINSLDAVKAVVVKDSDLPALVNQRVARIRVNSNEVTEEYITSFIYTQHFKRQIEKYASTSLQPNVSTNEVGKIKILVPEIEQQRKFSEIRRCILNERSVLIRNKDKSEELFSSLVQGVFG